MSSKNTYEVFNTSIEDYSINELYNLLELDELSREHILLKVHTLNNNVFKNNEPIKAFFLQAQNKLLNYLTVPDTNLDYYLHANANANIEPNIKEQFSNNEEGEEGEEDEEGEEGEDKEDEEGEGDVNIIETYVNHSNSITSPSTSSTTSPSTPTTNPTTNTTRLHRLRRNTLCQDRTLSLWTGRHDCINVVGTSDILLRHIDHRL